MSTSLIELLNYFQLYSCTTACQHSQNIVSSQRKVIHFAGGTIVVRFYMHQHVVLGHLWHFAGGSIVAHFMSIVQHSPMVRFYIDVSPCINTCSNIQDEMSRGMIIPTKWYIRPAKLQISLHIRAV